jgi:hypothetical protein
MLDQREHRVLLMMLRVRANASCEVEVLCFTDAFVIRSTSKRNRFAGTAGTYQRYNAVIFQQLIFRTLTGSAGPQYKPVGQTYRI